MLRTLNYMTEQEPFESTLVLVRHGQSEHNADNMHAGWIDSSLTAKGMEQALTAGQLIKEQNIHFDHVFASDLQRAHITAEKILEVLGQQQLYILRDPKIKERHCGMYEGEKRDLGRSFLKDPNIRPEGEGGESINDLCNGRIGSFIHKTLLPVLQKQQNILVVAHNQSIRAMMMVIIKELKSKELGYIYGKEIPNSAPCVFKLKKLTSSVDLEFKILK